MSPSSPENPVPAPSSPTPATGRGPQLPPQPASTSAPTLPHPAVAPPLAAPLPSLGELLRRLLTSRHLVAGLVYAGLMGLLLVGLLLLPFLYEEGADLRLVLTAYTEISVDGLWLLGVLLCVSAGRHLGQGGLQAVAAALAGRRGGLGGMGLPWWGLGAGTGTGALHRLEHDGGGTGRATPGARATPGSSRELGTARAPRPGGRGGGVLRPRPLPAPPRAAAPAARAARHRRAGPRSGP